MESEPGPTTLQVQALAGGWLARGLAIASTAVWLLTRVHPLRLGGAGALASSVLRGMVPA